MRRWGGSSKPQQSSCARCEALEPRRLLSVSLVTDLNATPVGASSNDLFTYGTMLALGNRVLFTAREPATGYELWRSDGTDAGTRPVIDLAPGPASSSPKLLATSGPFAYFLAQSSDLYRTDGTAGGTVLLSKITPPGSGAVINRFADVNGSFFFDVRYPVAQSQGTLVDEDQLWKSDGTPQGTVLLHDFIFPGLNAAGVQFITNVNGRAFFTIMTPSVDLYRSDGTSAGTIFVHRLAYSPHDPIALGSELLFGLAGQSGVTLWKSDGTDAGTQAVKKIGTVQFDDLANFVTFNGAAYFNLTLGRGLYQTDGTAEGTKLVADMPPGVVTSTPGIAVADGGVYVRASDNNVYFSDGASSTAVLASPSFATASAVLGSKLLFDSHDAGHGIELWVADPDPGSGHLLKDINPGTASSVPGLFTPAGDRVFFRADDGAHGNELWVTDGTEPGTHLVKDVNYVTDSSLLSQTQVVGNIAFFMQFTGRTANLWRTDGTAVGTTLVKSLPSTASRPIADAHGLLYFTVPTTTGNSLWRSDGTPDGTRSILQANSDVFDLTPMADGLYFLVFGFGGAQLWRTDGTAAGTVPIYDFTADSLGTFIGELNYSLVAIGSELYVAVNGVDSAVLFKTDGTTFGTSRVATLKGIQNLTSFHDMLVFSGKSADTYTVWKSDGTAAGTAQLSDVEPTIFGYTIPTYITAGDFFYFSGTTLQSGTELWKSDGTAAGTTLVKDIAPGGNSSRPHDFAVAGDRLFFLASGSDPQEQDLWVADANGATPVKPIASTSRGASVLGAFGGLLYFSASPDPAVGNELYVSDGTPNGTTLVKDINVGPDDSNPGNFTPFGDIFLFTADDGLHGRELWRLDSLPASISGRVFDDRNHNGVDDQEPALAGVTVYIDSNANGAYDPGEISVRTDANGNYAVPRLSAGTYAIRHLPPPGFARTTTPAAGAVTVGGELTAAGPDFGDVQRSSVALDFAYLLTLAQHYNQPGTFATGDLNADDKVDFDDLLILAQNYGGSLDAKVRRRATGPHIARV